jgi:branched-chain amino acid transport system ATP-binding protein
MTSLKVAGLNSGYGRIQILSDVSLEAKAGAVTCIFGPNGCGKSTLLRTIVGAVDTWSGSVHMGDQNITGLPSHRVLLQGVTLMPQGGGVFPALSVKENLLMGAYCLPTRSQRNQAVEQQLENFPRLRERLSTRAGQLSGGEQMMLSIARSLMLNPKFILFDEPSAGLSPKLVTEALQRVASLAKEGVGVLMVEQNIQQALQVADYIYILANGMNRFGGTPAEIPGQKEFMQMYLGVQGSSKQTKEVAS